MGEPRRLDARLRLPLRGAGSTRAPFFVDNWAGFAQSVVSYPFRGSESMTRRSVTWTAIISFSALTCVVAARLQSSGKDSVENASLSNQLIRPKQAGQCLGCDLAPSGSSPRAGHNPSEADVAQSELADGGTTPTEMELLREAAARGETITQMLFHAESDYAREDDPEKKSQLQLRYIAATNLASRLAPIAPKRQPEGLARKQSEYEKLRLELIDAGATEDEILRRKYELFVGGNNQ